VDRDSASAIKETSFRVFTGLTEETFKVLSDPREDKNRGTLNPTGPKSSATGAEEGGTDIDTLPETTVAGV
jgi:hypothetical protein